MAKRRKIESEGEARECLAAAGESGEGAGKWARAHGIDGRSLNAWRMNLARRGANAPARPRGRGSRPVAKTCGLVELVPTTMAGRSAGAGARVRYVLEVSGARVEFGDDFAETTLRRVLEVLRSC